SPGPRWFQLYTTRDFGVATERVRRAEAAGCLAVVLTVDLPALGVRYRGFSGFDELREDDRVILGELVTSANPGLDWDEVERIASLTRLPLVLKGLLHPADVALAAEHGVAAVVVSNHGARQLDGSIPTALALPECVAA